MNEARIIKVFQIVKDACQSEANPFGNSIFRDHVLEVVKHGVTLSRMLNCDEETVVLASLLHDYAGIKKLEDYPEHHIKSAQLAFQILSELGYNAEKVRAVCQCILEHRGSVPMEKRSQESICLASADAMSHLTKWPTLLNYAQKNRRLTYAEAKVWVKSKLERSWYKLDDAFRPLVITEYEGAINHLKSGMVS